MTPKMSPWWVYKFGGTSMGSAERIESVAKIVINSIYNEQKIRITDRRLAVVVSAMSGITDALLNLTVLAASKSPELAQKIVLLKEKHVQVASALLSPPEHELFIQNFEANLKTLATLLDSVALAEACSTTTKDFISGLGEVWSAQLLSAYLRTKGYNCNFLDARDVLIASPSSPSPIINWNLSEQNISKHTNTNCDFIIITGFVCKTSNNIPATLGRNGSDYSASIFGYLLNAIEVVIWTDVDGVMSADPRRVPDAVVIPELSYREAMELAYFGAKVLHPLTMVPAIAKNIPILIKNTFRPHIQGSLIKSSCTHDKIFAVKGCTTVDNVALVNIHVVGMQNMGQVVNRLFSALNEEQIDVIMSTIGSPGNAISLAIKSTHLEKTTLAFTNTFAKELQTNDILPLEIQKDCAILAVVGDSMIKNIGLSARVLGALAKANINVCAIAQGSEERNISAVIKAKDTNKGLQAVHAGFYLSPQTLSVGILGTELLTQEFIEQLLLALPKLKEKNYTDVRIKGIYNSNKMVLTPSNNNVLEWKDNIQSNGINADINTFINHIEASGMPHSVIIDCTNSLELAQLYPNWIQKGIHVITANKNGNASSLALYKTLQTQMRDYKRHYLFESSICGVLPVIDTLADLIETGDEVHKLIAIITAPLTEIQKNLVVLSREMGLNINVDDIKISQQITSGAGDIITALCTILINGNINIELFDSIKHETFANRSSTEDIVMFYTKRFAVTPLTLRGPITSIQATAAAILSDVLRLTRYLGSMG